MIFSIHYNTVWGENLRLVSGDKSYRMKWNEGNVWTANIRTPLKTYHYELYHENDFRRRENGQHRLSGKGPVRDKWIDWPVVRGAGTAVPVFSLRSIDDFGIGDFRDLHALVDWAVLTGQKIIQLLPVNDTTRHGGWGDSYPYSPISVFALHPMYIRLQDIGVEEDEEFKREQAALNALPEIDYPRVFETKMKYIRRAWEKKGEEDARRAEFKKFSRDNDFWLKKYCAFCVMRDGVDESQSSFYRWVQFHLDRQLQQESSYARSKGVYFKGDLPIGVARDGADAYFLPEYFNLDKNTGVPPDFFSEDGQNWGFPSYNWDNMSHNGYLWWRKRLEKMSEYFSAYRIDHILGWFRIWEIPVEMKSGKAGKYNPALPYSRKELKERGLDADERLFIKDDRRKGYFHPMISPDFTGIDDGIRQRFEALHNDYFFRRNNEFWKKNAEKKMPALLGASDMLACGEDLGLVADSVYEVMDQYGILSLELPIMDKGRPWPRLSVCTTSTHDFAPLRCSRGGDLSPRECSDIIKGVLSSQSKLAILPLQDWLSMSGELRRKEAAEERINEPADSNHHWRWRFHLNLENLLEAEALNSEIKTMLSQSGRI